MQPSSLVFLVIIAVWAAFFVQHWVRRREHLSTARSVDQFSEAMRVLERRSPLPVTDLSSPSPRSYAVQPARPARAQILVKRAETTPALSGGAAGAAFDESADGRPRPTTTAGGASARRTRAMVMLGALSTVVVAVPLLVMGLLPLWVASVPAGCVAVAIAFARATASAERRARATNSRSGSVRRSAPADMPSPVAEAAVASPAVASPAVAEALDTSAAVDGVDVATQASPQTAPRDELYDVQAEEARVAAPAAALPELRPVAPRHPLVDEDDIPLTWDPVPVPRPTYTMKARVTRPAPTSADLVGDADTEYAAYEEPVRRVAGA